jgi:hypothetical protein
MIKAHGLMNIWTIDCHQSQRMLILSVHAWQTPRLLDYSFISEVTEEQQGWPLRGPAVLPVNVHAQIQRLLQLHYYLFLRQVSERTRRTSVLSEYAHSLACYTQHGSVSYPGAIYCTKARNVKSSHFRIIISIKIIAMTSIFRIESHRPTP